METYKLFGLKGMKYLKNYGKFDLVVPITSFCFLWDIAVGLGWIRSIFKFMKVGIISPLRD